MHFVGRIGRGVKFERERKRDRKVVKLREYIKEILIRTNAFGRLNRERKREGERKECI